MIKSILSLIVLSFVLLAWIQIVPTIMLYSQKVNTTSQEVDKRTQELDYYLNR
jgi:hypothetical protein